MFSIEAMLTVPLSLTVFIQGILYLKPVQMRIENQICIIAEARMTKEKNQNLYSFQVENTITKLEVNPQKIQEIISFAHDIYTLSID
ncbi:MAG: hypothetical protein GX909_01035 [Clostridiaceae bacterium]|nr:hypothetical protein [Clostridiaceae bacterium]